MQHEYVLRDELGLTEPRRFTLSPTGLLSTNGAAQPLKILRREASGLLVVLWGERVISGVVRSSGVSPVNARASSDRKGLQRRIRLLATTVRW